MTAVKTLMTATALAAVLAGPVGEAQARCPWCGIATGVGAGLFLGGVLAAPHYAPPPPYYAPPPQPYYAPPQPSYAPTQQPRYAPPTNYAPATDDAPDKISIFCDPGRVLAGDPGSDDITSIQIEYSPGRWSIQYNLTDRRRVNRNTQYTITDNGISADAKDLQWSGTLRTNPAITMIGQLSTANNHITYDEWQGENGRVTMHSSAFCPPTAAPLPSAVPLNPAPPSSPVSTTAPGEDSIPITVTEGSKAHTIVQVGSHLASMLLDTGATHMLVTPSVASALVSNGEARVIGSAPVDLAGGSTVTEQVISIKRIKIGTHVFLDIDALVAAKDKADMLFPLSLLGWIGKFTFDLPNNKLIFN